MGWGYRTCVVHSCCTVRVTVVMVTSSVNQMWWPCFVMSPSNPETVCLCPAAKVTVVAVTSASNLDVMSSIAHILEDSITNALPNQIDDGCMWLVEIAVQVYAAVKQSGTTDSMLSNNIGYFIFYLFLFTINILISGCLVFTSCVVALSLFVSSCIPVDKHTEYLWLTSGVY